MERRNVAITTQEKKKKSSNSVSSEFCLCIWLIKDALKNYMKARKGKK